ncbi:hypothetical protein C8R48DRAFT_719118 [Suillus tomentosus]|nr:hypothetical protein C8R48DRAFT_719118 [Suillus tomentosus]
MADCISWLNCILLSNLILCCRISCPANSAFRISSTEPRIVHLALVDGRTSRCSQYWSWYPPVITVLAGCIPDEFLG